MKLESDLWKWLSKRVPRDYDFSRVESPVTPGMSDIYLRSKVHGIRGWIELKVVKSMFSKVKFEDNQPQWIEDEYISGGLILIMIYVKEQSTIEIFSGNKIRHLVNKSLAEVHSEYVSAIEHDHKFTSTNVIKNAIEIENEKIRSQNRQ